jgi:hypothetical protein
MSNKIHIDYRNFIGIVEDINDPLELGRIRVRCIGYHTDSKLNIPVSSLPWAHVTMPVTSASLAGIGESSTGVVQGSWVAGYFIDGEVANNPIVTGTLPSMSGAKRSTQLGFSDPAGIHPITENTPDIPVESTKNYKESSAYRKRVENRAEATGVAGASGSWNIPLPAEVQAPEYPNNHTKHTLSGHVIELDDTPGKERILLHHKSGTHIEIDSDGNIIHVDENNCYKLVKAGCYTYIKGSKSTTVDGGEEVYVKGNQTIKVDGNIKVNAGGNINMTAGGEIIMKAKAIRLN